MTDTGRDSPEPPKQARATVEPEKALADFRKGLHTASDELVRIEPSKKHKDLSEHVCTELARFDQIMNKSIAKAPSGDNRGGEEQAILDNIGDFLERFKDQLSETRSSLKDVSTGICSHNNDARRKIASYFKELDEADHNLLFLRNTHAQLPYRTGFRSIITAVGCYKALVLSYY